MPRGNYSQHEHFPLALVFRHNSSEHSQLPFLVTAPVPLAAATKHSRAVSPPMPRGFWKEMDHDRRKAGEPLDSSTGRAKGTRGLLQVKKSPSPPHREDRYLTGMETGKSILQRFNLSSWNITSSLGYTRSIYSTSLMCFVLRTKFYDQLRDTPWCGQEI